MLLNPGKDVGSQVGAAQRVDLAKPGGTGDVDPGPSGQIQIAARTTTQGKTEYRMRAGCSRSLAEASA